MPVRLCQLTGHGVRAASHTGECGGWQVTVFRSTALLLGDKHLRRLTAACRAREAERSEARVGLVEPSVHRSLVTVSGMEHAEGDRQTPARGRAGDGACRAVAPGPRRGPRGKQPPGAGGCLSCPEHEHVLQPGCLFQVSEAHKTL